MVHVTLVLTHNSPSQTMKMETRTKNCYAGKRSPGYFQNPYPFRLVSYYENNVTLFETIWRCFSSCIHSWWWEKLFWYPFAAASSPRFGLECFFECFKPRLLYWS